MSTSNPNDGGAAFPQHGWSKDPEVLERMKNQGGMTLRDYFAGQALAGMLAGQEIDSDTEWNLGAFADHCYRFADAMLVERSKGFHERIIDTLDRVDANLAARQKGGAA